MATTLSRTPITTSSTPKVGFDIFRFENGKIAEHWDTIESILPEDKRLNVNGKFGF
ncbi:MAG: hypothetical protein IJV37_05220 [Bacteroidales bacterium]|nr:hypothetical protein [Bacteroidales bacterium]